MHDVIDTGQDIMATDWETRGLHVIDPAAVGWQPPVKRPVLGQVALRPEHDDRPRDPDFVEEKSLVYPMPGEDRFPISIIKFPPNFVFPRHWHTDGEFVMILAGEADFAGRTLGPGAMAYNDARIVYGAEAAGPNGCEFLIIRRAWAETHIVDDHTAVPADVQDTGRDEIAGDRRQRGLHLLDLDVTPWTMPVVRPVLGNAPLLPEDDTRPLIEGSVWEKSLVYPMAGDDRFPISVVRFPPNFTFHRHWHTDGEFIRVLKGSLHLAGTEVGPGAMAYNDARTVYGTEASGKEGCEFLMIRRAWAETHVTGA